MQLHTKKSKKRRYFIISTISLAVFAVAWIGFTILGKSTENASSNNTATGSNETSQSNPTSSTSNSSGPASSDSSSETAPTIDASVTPIAPSGTFISSHHLSLSDNYTVTSTCSTTPGATCTILFTQGSSTRSLDTKTSDANGNVSWTWTLKDLDFITGDWTISATAANGNKTSIANDSLNLEVTE